MTEKLTREHGPLYRRFAKRRWARYVRRAARLDPEDAPRRLSSKGWA